MTDHDPLWYKDAIIYEVHVRAFHDSIGDGTGDFKGLTQKLDYLEDLGVTAIWLLPFYPSPLKDDGYDVADYVSVHPDYGRLADFREFLAEAHKRNLRVITELVINHTSDQHPWFQRARNAPPGSPERDFYVWSDTPEKYKLARIIFKDFEPSNWTYDRVAKQYYWHRFYSHQPDLNFDNPAVWEAIFRVLDFWLDMGVDGMRLDAIPYLFEREGTNCENLAETHVFLKALRKRMDEKYPGRMFLAEANQWPEDAVAYFGDGDECHAAFHFPVMPRLYVALHREDRYPILDVLAQTPPIPDNCQWCMFLRNHDELTLEMVTDEERDYAYRAYAEDRQARINFGIRRRLAPLLRNDRRRIELLNALLFSLPGTPVLYYGDEIGMGDNIYLGDRNGVRTPMQWSADRNAGFSRANPQSLYLPIIIDPEYHYEAINVEAQQNNPSSLLWWTKRLIALRKRFRAFGRGTIEFLHPSNTKVLAFVRQYGDECVLVVANLSRFVQYTEIDLGKYAGMTVEETFGRSLFPTISDRPYPLTLGPHAFYWFSLGPIEPARRLPGELPVLAAWSADAIFNNAGRDRLEALLPAYLQRRWPGGAPAQITAAHVGDVAKFENDGLAAWLVAARLEFNTGVPEALMLPLMIVSTERGDLLESSNVAALARVSGLPGGDHLLVDALATPEYCNALTEVVARGATFRLADGDLSLVALPGLAELATPAEHEPPPTLQRTERNNVSVTFGQRLLYKSYRRMEEGVSPDVELGRALTERGTFTEFAPILGYVEFRSRKRKKEPATLAVVHRYVPNQGHAWQYTLDQIASFYERIAALTPEQAAVPLTPGGPVPLEASHELMGGYLDSARQMAQLTARMHQALANLGDTPAFAPEPINRLYQRSLCQSVRNLIAGLCSRIERDLGTFPTQTREASERLMGRRREMTECIQPLLNGEMGGQRIRCQGDYHLGELLHTGAGFVVTDFEGDPSRSIGERRVKRSPLRDVASMVRSFDYAARCVLLGLATGRGRPPGLVRAEDRAALAPWAAAWARAAARTFVLAYEEVISDAGLLPDSQQSRRALLEVLILEKSLQEAEAELTFRPAWAELPLDAAVAQLTGESRLNPW